MPAQLHLSSSQQEQQAQGEPGGELEEGDVPRDCAFVLHLRNLVDSERHLKVVPPKKNDPDWCERG